jgi:hypothetical protein
MVLITIWIFVLINEYIKELGLNCMDFNARQYSLS